MRWFRSDPDKAPVDTATVDTPADAAADEAVRDARDTSQRVQKLTRGVQSSLRELEAHRRDNHILDAMLETLGRHR